MGLSASSAPAVSSCNAISRISSTIVSSLLGGKGLRARRHSREIAVPMLQNSGLPRRRPAADKRQASRRLSRPSSSRHWDKSASRHSTQEARCALVKEARVPGARANSRYSIGGREGDFRCCKDFKRLPLIRDGRFAPACRRQRRRCHRVRNIVVSIA